MALKLPKSSGLFKDGYKSLQGTDEAVLSNINAVHELTEIVRTSLGPNGRLKLVVNHLGKQALTNNSSTILKEIDVVHPAAKLLVMASQQQEAELGDATNLVVVFGGELLTLAQDLLRMGLLPPDIIAGYELGRDYALQALEKLAVDRVSDLHSQEEIAKAIRATIGAKQYGNEDFLSKLVAKAVLTIMPKNPTAFNVDNIRVVKIMGGGLEDSDVVKGMVFSREPTGVIRKAKNAKVAVYSCPIDISQTETKGTVLLHNAKEMLDFSKGEEVQLEKIIKEIHDAGVRVVIAGQSLGELALHYLNRYSILVIKVLSKFDLRRLCRVVGATPLARLGAPMPDEMGSIDVVEVVEMGGDRVTVFKQENDMTRTATIVLRGATQNYLDDLERAIDDGVSVVKAITKDPRLVPGAGATEMELLKRVLAQGEKTPGLLQHSIKKYAEAFEVIPRTLAETSGVDATEVLSKLYTAHHNSEDGLAGVDIENEEDGVIDAKAAGILDVLSAKSWAIKLATDAALTILSVDQIIMSKPAGGPKVPGPNPNWDED